MGGGTGQLPVKGSGVAFVVLEEPEKGNLGVGSVAYGDCTPSSVPCSPVDIFWPFLVQLLSLHPEAFKLKLLDQWKWVVWILLRTTKDILFLLKHCETSIQEWDIFQPLIIILEHPYGRAK